jgi:serine/threonine protein phosphatase PrpC
VRGYGPGVAAVERQRKRRNTRSGSPLPVRVRGAGDTNVGHVRGRNEDVLVVEPELGLYAVLDGMGNAGDVAAKLASEVIVNDVREQARIRRRSRRWCSPDQMLKYALHDASTDVMIAGETKAECRGMRTTAVVCLIVDPMRVVVAHVGDSRAYLFRAGELTQLTHDHTVAQEFVDAGRLSARSARRSPKRHLLTRALGRTSVPLQVDVREQTLRSGDRLLLCSDGLYGYLSARSIRRMMAAEGTPEQVAHELVALVLRGEAPDNVSAVVISVEGGRCR